MHQLGAQALHATPTLSSQRWALQLQMTHDVPNAKVKVSSKLADNEVNYALWKRDLEGACTTKGECCGLALLNPLPSRVADGAIQHVIRSSIPEWLAEETQDCECANHGFEHITKHFTGGTNWEQNDLWCKELMTIRMTSSEKSRVFVLQKEALFVPH